MRSLSAAEPSVTTFCTFLRELSPPSSYMRPATPHPGELKRKLWRKRVSIRGPADVSQSPRRYGAEASSATSRSAYGSIVGNWSVMYSISGKTVYIPQQRARDPAAGSRTSRNLWPADHLHRRSCLRTQETVTDDSAKSSISLRLAEVATEFGDTENDQLA